MKAELWKTVPGYSGYYEVSNLGRVRSLDRTILCSVQGRIQKRLLSGRLISPGYTKAGYPYLSLTKDGVPHAYRVNQLVAKVFIKKTNVNHDTVLHKDDDPTNNRVSNLRWGTQLQNIQDMVKKKRQRGAVGENNSKAKLVARDVLRIRKLSVTRSRSSIAKEFSVSLSLINQIINRNVWNHV